MKRFSIYDDYGSLIAKAETPKQVENALRKWWDNQESEYSLSKDEMNAEIADATAWCALRKQDCEEFFYQGLGYAIEYEAEEVEK